MVREAEAVALGLAGMRGAAEMPVRRPLPVRVVSGPVLMAMPGVLAGQRFPPMGPVRYPGPDRYCRRPRRLRRPHPHSKRCRRHRCQRPQRRPRHARLLAIETNDPQWPG